MAAGDVHRFSKISGNLLIGGDLSVDTISEKTAAVGVTIDGVKLKDSEPYCDVINEKTAATGVTIDGAKLKDNLVEANLKDGVLIGSDPIAKINIVEFTGDGGATKAITGIGFLPKLVMIFAQADNQFRNVYWKSEEDSTFALINEFNTVKTLYKEDVIISLDADGFTIGDSENMNSNAIVHTCICIG